MPKDDHLELAGTIKEAIGGGQYEVTLDEGGRVIRARLCGKMKQFRIRVIPGDRVKVAVSPYDTTHGMITFREKLR